MKKTGGRDDDTVSQFLRRKTTQNVKLRDSPESISEEKNDTERETKRQSRVRYFNGCPKKYLEDENDTERETKAPTIRQCCTPDAPALRNKNLNYDGFLPEAYSRTEGVVRG